jgi:hypothetical protein
MAQANSTAEGLRGWVAPKGGGGEGRWVAPMEVGEGEGEATGGWHRRGREGRKVGGTEGGGREGRWVAPKGAGRGIRLARGLSV